MVRVSSGFFGVKKKGLNESGDFSSAIERDHPGACRPSVYIGVHQADSFENAGWELSGP
jgi:hypothetical protein